MKNKIIWKFLSAFILPVLIVVIVLNYFVSLKLRDYYELKISQRLASNALLVGDILRTNIQNNRQKDIQAKVEELAAKLNSRITIIDNKGKVLGDSEEDHVLMEDHSDRLEIIRAMESGVGESNRFSDTLGFNMKYVAVAVRDNGGLIGIVRIALPLTEVESQIRVIYGVVFLGGIFAIVFVLITGYFISRNIAKPIMQMKETAQALARGDFSRRINIDSADELGVLAKSLNKMADELQVKIDSLKKMNEIRTDFVANVSHELKTPLTSIKGFIETLEDGAIDDKKNAKRFIAIIKKHTDSLSNIVNDLLSLSELESLKERLQETRFNLKDLIEEVGLGFGHALGLKRQELQKHFVGNDFDIKADRLKIEQILVNLIDNAIKYTKDKGRIIVSVADKGDSLAIAVEDNGVGIPQEHLKRIFERFYRVDKARSRQLGGTGLGLAIVRHIVSLHKGNIAVESKVDSGTKVTVTLPKISQ